MPVRVARFANPSLERSVVREDMHYVADTIHVTENGDLEVIDTTGDEPVTVKAYASGHWIGSEVAIRTRDGRTVWRD